jgi:hypothetical protein
MSAGCSQQLQKTVGTHVLRVLSKITKKRWGTHVLRVLSEIAKTLGDTCPQGALKITKNVTDAFP